MVKPSPVPGSGLYLQAHAQTESGGTYEDVWRVTADATPLPIERWMTVEMHLLEGNSGSGRFEMWLTVDGESRQRIIEVTGATHHPDDCAPDGFTDFSPLKLYTSAELIGALGDLGEPLTVYWDDFEIFVGPFP